LWLLDTIHLAALLPTDDLFALRFMRLFSASSCASRTCR
jgi:hypothetical protein